MEKFLALMAEDIIPVRSAKAERRFSQMNLVVTDTRANLILGANIRHIGHTQLNGPPAAL